MDVTCPRCQTDYEFDDALVSERGTTVKCTNCGHQFRVFRPRAAASTASTTPEMWRIERRQGEPLELRSLVELQRAIRAGRVSRDDLLRRADAPSRRVGDIPELEPFFPSARSDGAPNTLPLPSAAEPLIAAAPRVPAHTPSYTKTPSVPSPRIATLRPTAGGPPPRQSDRLPPAPRLPTPLGLAPPQQIDPNVVRRPSGPPPPPKTPPRTPPPPMAPPLRMDLPRVSSRAEQQPEPEPPTIRRSDTSRTASVPAPQTSAAVPTTERPPREESYDSLFPPPRKKSSAGWIFALLVIGGLVAAGATVGRPHLEKLWRGAPAASSAPGSDRLTRELAAADRARDDGDWAGARDAYLRATVVDEKSLAAWDGLCTAESELAMAHWIAAVAGHSTLERDQAASIGSSASTSCGRWSELARGTPDGPKKVSADLRPVRAVAAQNDASAVRVYLPMHPGNPIVEALAYLADVPKGDDKALAAATKNAQPALARADISKLDAAADLALVAYAAGTAGNAARAQLALTELAKRAPRHVLLETLRGMSLPTTDAGVAGDAAVTADAGAADAKHGVVAVGGGGGGGGGGGEEAPGGDYRALNEKGHKALAGGEVAKAETYFKAALAQHPGDVDALFGLGQIARSRGEHAAAITYFQQVLSTSAGFAPARLALADEQWATGDKTAAAKNYELYLERVSEGSGADRARSRLGKETPKPDPKPEDKEP